MSSIITEYPIWFIIFCLALGFLYAWLLYRKGNKFTETSKLIRKLMFALRFLVVSIISFFLLSPIIKSLGKIIEQPIVVYAQDNSQSVSSDKANIKLFSESIFNFFKNKQEEYTFKTYTFGDKTLKSDSFNFSEKQTDISQLISNIKDKYYNRNIGALIIASDGIYNKGTNPIYRINDASFPVYTIALGDTTVKEDLILSNVKHNKIAFLNNTYPIQVSVKAKKLKGKRSEIQIFNNGKLIKSQQITINNNDFFKNYNFEIKANKLGFHKLKIKLKELKEEINLKNNSKQIITEVTDSKQKVLILANSPHPDIAAIRQSLELNQNFETDFYLVNKFKKSVLGYNLIILHQLPSKYNSGTAILSQIAKYNIPVLYILGGQSSLTKFDNLNTGLTTGAYANSADEVHGTLNKNFNLFNINPDVEEISLNAPPMLSAFGTYKTTANAQILFSRKVRNIDTGLPLIVFSGNGQKRNAVITGEGLWRWRIYDYKLNQNHYLFNELINKTVQYLVQRETKEHLKIIIDKIIPENQDLVIKAEVFNDKFELVNKKDVKISITDTLKQVKEFLFEKDTKSYKINVGKLAIGDYSWKAETVLKGKKYKKEGVFSVVPLNIEFENTTANHNILYKISENTGGKLFYPNQINDLLKTIKTNENIVPVSYSEKKTEDLINNKILFFLIILLLSVEWFMRKFYGGY